ncbi:MAG: hypothetical protein NUV77_21115 [Thermoguttaceae bacterium]|jgi:hypothetical protein|nr:hypothetical protein [Thermoguttaceae bacterium]
MLPNGNAWHRAGTVLAARKWIARDGFEHGGQIGSSPRRGDCGPDALRFGLFRIPDYGPYVRHAIWIVIVLVAGGWLATELPSGSTATTHEPSWRRTRDGWERKERVVITPPVAPPTLHPVTVALFQVLAAALALAALAPARRRSTGGTSPGAEAPNPLRTAIENPSPVEAEPEAPLSQTAAGPTVCQGPARPTACGTRAE